MVHRITESSSLYDNIEQMPISQIIASINGEDKKIASAVEDALPMIEKLTEVVIQKLSGGGRLFYIGAGTSGRLGIVDASEIPPTYGVHDMIIGLIAGGDNAIRHAAEHAEDDLQQGWIDLQQYAIHDGDFLIGIASSGTTPYVLGALQTAKKNGVSTGCIVCNPESPIAAHVDHPIEVFVGPEFITGSTRMKSGTAQKLVLNIISTTAMAKLGYVKGNKMVHMQMACDKLKDRGVRMVVDALSVDESTAKELIAQHGSVAKVLEAHK